jgi:hypothetical protein
MKQLSFIIILICFCNSGNSQIVKGYVMDQDTQKKIIFATAYFNGTYMGTNTDQDGYFELNIPKNVSMPLTISALGYYSATLAEYSTDKINSIYLKPKLYQLKEVVITAKNNLHKRRFYMNLFKKEFLGTSTNANNCKIINEADIEFSYNNEYNIFTAFSSNPIQINNKSLGYKINYFLDKFEFRYPKEYGLIHGQILGNSIFLENPRSNLSQQKRFKRRRENTYLGSRMHFIRELWENRLDSAGFELKDSINTKVTYNEIVVQSDSLPNSDREKYLKFNGKLNIRYNSKPYTSTIKMVKDSIYFDKNGFFDPLCITWGGVMSDQRIGDLLPLEYKINKNSPKRDK